MNTSQAFIPIALVTLLVLAVAFILVGRRSKGNQLTPLAGLSFGMILAGVLFGDHQTFGYSMIGLGVLMAVADIIYKLRRKE